MCCHAGQHPLWLRGRHLHTPTHTQMLNRQMRSHRSSHFLTATALWKHLFMLFRFVCFTLLRSLDLVNTRGLHMCLFVCGCAVTLGDTHCDGGGDTSSIHLHTDAQLFDETWQTDLAVYVALVWRFFCCPNWWVPLFWGVLGWPSLVNRYVEM